jgi:hypothetical protein
MILCLVTLTVVATACTASQAQTLMGSSGAGWQNWSLAVDSNSDYIDLNSNGFPYWDYPLLTFNNSGSVGYGFNPANKSVGWCMTSTGDCQGVGSALFAPGPLPFWGMPYNAAADTGGAIDPKMYFKSAKAGQSYLATLFLNSATNSVEINEFGWFETDATGAVNGTKHILFHGSGFPPGTAVPDPIGKTVTFTPTQYYGFYFSDVSDEEDSNGPPHGCWAYTIFTFNDPDCTLAAGQGDHVFAIFKQSPALTPTYWVAGQDPTMCSFDGDCNLTMVRVSAVPKL